ncbi:hypothetical protein TNCV_1474401 [Trichonephila clavipes]|nr:hypothetical protein TNCV_1474401 [Trichonephila clavipes]
MVRFHIYLSNKILSFRPTEPDPANPNHRQDKTPARRGSFMCCKDVPHSHFRNRGRDTRDQWTPTWELPARQQRGNNGEKTASTVRWL